MIKLRPESRFFATMCLGFAFYFIACNSGSGWLYLLGASMATVAVIGLIFPAVFCSKIRVTQQAPSRCVAGQAITVAIKVSSTLPWGLPLYWLRAGYEFGGSISRPYSMRSAKTDDAVLVAVPAIQRGVHALGNIRMSTCFPVGMVWAERTYYPPAGRSITAYPRTVAVDGFFLYKLPPSAAGSGGLARGARAARQSTSTRGVREYVRGDSPRIVHWASTARTGRLLVREFEAEGLPRFDVRLDLSAPWQNQAQFELAVMTAASLLSLGYRLGTAPHLVIHPHSSIEAMSLPLCTPGIESDMEILARVQPLTNATGSAASAVAPEKPMRVSAQPDPGRSIVAIGPCGCPRIDDSYTIEIAAASQHFNSPSSPSSSFARPLIRDEEDICKL